jgi:hypothetical protein
MNIGHKSLTAGTLPELGSAFGDIDDSANLSDVTTAHTAHMYLHADSM